MIRLHLNISGMHCDGCAASIRDALRQAEGVMAADVMMDEANVSIDEARCGVSDVVAAVRQAGEFEVTGFAAGNE